MYTDITLITLAIRARKFKAKVNISSRKLFLAGQKIAGISGLDMLLHYVTQDKIFPFPKQLPTQAGSCTRQARAQLKAPLKTSSLGFCLPPCPPSSVLSTRFNFASIHTGKIKRDFIPTKAWITRASVLLVAKSQAYGIHTLSLVGH